MGMEFWILHQLQKLHGPILDELMVMITFLGDKGWVWIATGLILCAHPRTRPCGIGVLLSLLAGFLLGNCLLKNLVHRSRPCWLAEPELPLLIAIPGDYSFPSGHTLASVESAVTIYFYRKKWGIAALALAALIGFSRLYLFVHFPTDVLAGLLLGIGIAFGVHWGMEQYREKREMCKDA